ncbi:uncharacterized protein LOC122263572 [Penaeus japonicus]|uniref:uncharacterized protein LOC122263572 n=1 Tax=Penaeus japonicus TaxID=27405 RepID=UPI001C71407D|nr:uncharacterized protein LOC122263572 [Penaeus japonicus]
MEVQYIRDRTSPEEWKYINSVQNPADAASRVCVKNLINHSSWWNGPNFLWEPTFRADLSSEKIILKENDPEVKNVSSHKTSSKKVHHQGRGIILNELRASGYWIIGGSTIVARHIFRCVTCKRLRGTFQEQKMSDLPPDRLEPTPPFTYSAADYFGPFFVKEGHKETLDQFVSLDQTKMKFVGAKNELQECLQEMDQKKLTRELLKENCDLITFEMNIPHASHMCGVWERQILTVRNILTAMLHHHSKQLDDESLRTLMVEAETIVNGRPLTVDNISSQSLEPLTPNHLLTMKTKVVLPPPGAFQSDDQYSRKRWRRVQYLANEFWNRWKREYVQSLQSRNKWTRVNQNLNENDIVIVKEPNLPRNSWKLGRVSEVIPSKDGLGSHVNVATFILKCDTLNTLKLQGAVTEYDPRESQFYLRYARPGCAGLRYRKLFEHPAATDHTCIVSVLIATFF